MFTAGYGLVIQAEKDMSPPSMGHRQQVNVVGDISLVVAHGTLIRQPEILDVQDIEVKNLGRRVAQTNTPRPGGLGRMQAERSRELKTLATPTAPGGLVRVVDSGSVPPEEPNRRVDHPNRATAPGAGRALFGRPG